jgi:tetrahedral aminopeptidase
MNKESLAFLTSIEETPSVTGYEAPVARIVAQRMKKWADTIETDVHGNLIVCANAGAKTRVMLAGHMDQIGLMVHYISDDGFLHFKAVGGVDAAVLPGSQVTVHTDDGQLPGVIGRKAIHLMKESERHGGAKIDMSSDLWIDIGAKDKADAMKRVRIGDVATYKLGLVRLGSDLIASPGLDNKVGTFIVMEALRLAVESKKLKCALYAVATVQEEIGLRGARTSCFGIDPQVSIAVDVTHATDHPAGDKKQSGDIRCGKGAVIERGPNINHVLFDLLRKTAKKKDIPHQFAAAPSATGTDANAMQISRAGTATALIGVPNRYMHTPVEVCSLADLESCAKLLAEAVVQIDEKTDFVPR